MPYMKVQTNVEVGDNALNELLKGLSATVAEALGKPECYVMIALEDGTPMLFAGSDAPTAYVELKSLGLPENQTATLSATLCATLARDLGISRDRIYIEFASPERHMFGWNGATF